ncbi:Aldehyde dehydrogenase 22A1 [Hondaea fermentalgiana]|uniref:Aldehyde dehydrogenase 22A1 n=1 Tax=Hondaea fermentalgiana TaxID=2315210 RepID=A0A2R5GDM3_9STRA|nr:Aldehyde dehydrogenase 22A1 [Hondaea fermentalgiana]|eukprot:GBG29052.1 Aldehyde dehydrogenase 22A1 [Hondaea fermentalgiana]
MIGMMQEMDTQTLTLAVALVAAAWVGAALWYVLSPSDPVVEKIEFELEEYEAKDKIDAPVKEKMELEFPDRPGKLQCYDPATMQHLGEVEMMTRERVFEIVDKAHVAQREWAKTTFGQRRALLRALLDYYVHNIDDIVRVCVRDTGKTRLCAVLGEITPTCEKLRWMIAEGEKILATEYRGGQGPLTMHKSARVEYHPLGVIGVIAPFNYVGHNLMNHIISGLFAGNAVVCKVSEFSSWSADFLVRPVHVALKSMGFSTDLVQVVTGTAEAGSALTESRINKMVFTGSDKIGKLVMMSAAKNLTPVVLELGGKDPFVICEDVNLDLVVPTAMRGVFQNASANCIGIERIFVQESIHDKFVERVSAAVAQMKQAVPLLSHADIGAMTPPNAIEHIQRLVDDAKSKGAKVICGGKRNAALAPGQFYEPTILTNVEANMLITQEEVFGPVMCIRSWSTEDDLIEKANNCNYALASSVFSSSKARAARIGKRIDAGMLNENDFGTNYLCQQLPFGGCKASGFGKFAGPEGLRALCNVKSCTSDRIPGVQTQLPAPFVYPTALDAHKTAASLVGMGYSPSMSERAISLVQLLKGIMMPQQAPVSKKVD